MSEMRSPEELASHLQSTQGDAYLDELAKVLKRRQYGSKGRLGKHIVLYSNGEEYSDHSFHWIDIGDLDLDTVIEALKDPTLDASHYNRENGLGAVAYTDFMSWVNEEHFEVNYVPLGDFLDPFEFSRDTNSRDRWPEREVIPEMAHKWFFARHEMIPVWDEDAKGYNPDQRLGQRRLGDLARIKQFWADMERSGT